MNDDPGALADVLVVAAFVGILKPAPAAHVVDEDDIEIGAAVLDVLDHLLERITSRLSPLRPSSA
jgi:hypothetical protein